VLDRTWASYTGVVISRLPALSIIAFVLLPLHAEQTSISAALHTSDKPYIQTTGEATLSVKPDQALIDIGVVTEAPTAVAAAAQNAKQSDRLLSDLRRILGENGQLRPVIRSDRTSSTRSQGLPLRSRGTSRLML
jgi:uncharacterized protein YggE